MAYLTVRQRDVLALVAQGRPSKEIAAILKLSESTVQFHIGRVLATLRAKNRSEAVAIAIARGLIPSSRPGKPPK